jgi:hypothetical protein
MEYWKMITGPGLVEQCVPAAPHGPAPRQSGLRPLQLNLAQGPPCFSAPSGVRPHETACRPRPVQTAPSASTRRRPAVVAHVRRDHPPPSPPPRPASSEGNISILHLALPSSCCRPAPFLHWRAVADSSIPEPPPLCARVSAE